MSTHTEFDPTDPGRWLYDPRPKAFPWPDVAMVAFVGAFLLVLAVMI